MKTARGYHIGQLVHVTPAIGQPYTATIVTFQRKNGEVIAVFSHGWEYLRRLTP